MPFLLGWVYLYLVLVYFGRSEGGFGINCGRDSAFSNPPFFLAGWLHYLTFDLFIGSWEVKDA